VTGGALPSRIGAHQPRPDSSWLHSPSYSTSLHRGLAILECFSNQNTTLSIVEIAERLKLSRATTHRYATTAVRLGHLEQTPNRSYRLAAGAARPAVALLETIARYTNPIPALEMLRDATHGTVGLAILDGQRATYVQRLHADGRGQYQADLNLRAGAHIPLHCTAAGKAILASLSEDELRDALKEIRLTHDGPNAITSKTQLIIEIKHVTSDRIALSDQEQAAGVLSIAVPIENRYVEHPLAVDLTLPATPGADKHSTSWFAEHLEAAADDISAQLDKTPGPPPWRPPPRLQ
jgi:IclR family transcriptional regulator, pca regulon regulatory protein